MPACVLEAGHLVSPEESYSRKEKFELRAESDEKAIQGEKMWIIST